MSGQCILENGNPIPCNNLFEWAKWMETGERRIALTQITPDVKVSTVFLGLDHSFGGAVPILFESLVFGGPLDGEGGRYADREDAEKGHAALVERVTAAAAPTTGEGG